MSISVNMKYRGRRDDGLNNVMITVYFLLEIKNNIISIYCNNLDLLTPKPKFSYRYFKKGVQEVHMRFVLATAVTITNNVVVI